MRDRQELQRQRADRPLPALATELWEMVTGYLKQETIAPIKGLGRFVGLGLAGSLVLGVGLVLLLLAALRALQTEFDTPFDDDWSWVPYLITLAVAGAVASLAVRAIGSHRRRAAQKGTMS